MADLLRGRIYDNIAQTMGNTPLIRLPGISEGLKSDLCFKLEFFNPVASVKDRIGIAMIEAMEKSGTLKPGGIIVNPPLGILALRLPSLRRLKAIKLSWLCQNKCR